MMIDMDEMKRQRDEERERGGWERENEMDAEIGKGGDSSGGVLV